MCFICSNCFHSSWTFNMTESTLLCYNIKNHTKEHLTISERGSASLPPQPPRWVSHPHLSADETKWEKTQRRWCGDPPPRTPNERASQSFRAPSEDGRRGLRPSCEAGPCLQAEMRTEERQKLHWRYTSGCQDSWRPVFWTLFKAIFGFVCMSAGELGGPHISWPFTCDDTDQIMKGHSDWSSPQMWPRWRHGDDTFNANSFKGSVC